MTSATGRSTARLPVHFRGIVLGPSGYAAEGREWLHALELAGFSPSLEGASFGDQDCPLDADDRAVITRCAARLRVPGGITFHHLPPPHFTPDPHAARNVLRTMFETSSLPLGWGDSLARADLVIVPTDSGKQAFLRGGVSEGRLAVLPPPLEIPPITPRDPRRRPMRWLTIGEWTRRKGFDLLLRAFARAFQPAEATLLLKTSVRQGFVTELQQLCERLAPARVQVICETLSTAQLETLWRDADAFVLASRGEGWGRPVHEAMLRAIPVVATQAGALQTLMPNASCGWPVRARPIAIDNDAAREVPWFAGQQWHEPDLDELTNQLRAVAQRPEEAARRAQHARAHITQLCARDRVAMALRALLQQ